MRTLVVLFLLLLCACDSPGLRFSGATGKQVAVGAHRFTVYALPDEAQVIRTNRVLLPDRARARAAALIAAERASGCRVHRGRIKGDAAILTVGLIC